ncbi:diguanylate cyclase [Methylomonas methanica]|uniref:diguanylate cyclase n=1 Tax=Methylomonas methanica (strain DSM 25384 / MC09) TaxID=857087 RepID=G0A5P3_METMM|nr:diguanylate cyclase [Methylomonas methanica]AEG02900.1 diguanylate cyclase [Methylomonas methanica MC09]
MGPNNEISDETANFLDAYSLPSGVMNAEGYWLFKNLALKEYLAPLDEECFFALLKDRMQESAVKKLIMRNKRVQLVEAKLVANITNMIACCTRIDLANFSHPIYLIELHTRAQRLHAFSSLNRLHLEQNKHEKKVLTTNLKLQRAVSDSHIDPLTKIANRRVLEEELPPLWEQAFHSRSSFSFLILDLDFFKKINDTYGHSQGDKALILVAETLMNNVKRTGDIVTRFGGEEFAILLPNTDIIGAKWVSDKILVAVRQLNIPNEGSDVANYLTVSVGCYTATPSHLEADITNIIRLADLCLYQAKNKGRNCAVHYEVSRD